MFDDLSNRASEHDSNSLRDRIWRIIFLSDTKAGHAFDVALLWLIGISVGVVMLESVESYRDKHLSLFNFLEWTFTVLFTIEYIVRIVVVRNKPAYIFSFFGVVDLLSIIPTYLTFFIAGSEYFLVVRILRLLRVFRVLKMARHIGEANLLLNSFRASIGKITVFLFVVVAVTMILGTMMYVVEGLIAGNEGFNSVPQSIYWGIVTISTVGYGDVTPITVVGKFISTLIILIGYGTIAVPTGIVIAEANMSMAEVRLDKRRCRECGHTGHDPKATFCKMCGNKL
ncbi:MAG: ion transporter [Verrucomicrobiales bacterium]|nr:ion transporter [Verrucomicrobiales bacterium]